MAEQPIVEREAGATAKATKEPARERVGEAAAQVAEQPASEREGEAAPEATDRAEEDKAEKQKSKWDRLREKFRKEYLRGEEMEYGLVRTWEVEYRPGRMRPE